MKANIVGATTDALATALRRPGYGFGSDGEPRMRARDFPRLLRSISHETEPRYGLTLPSSLSF
jgi:hypothetical protein